METTGTEEIKIDESTITSTNDTITNPEANTTIKEEESVPGGQDSTNDSTIG